MRSAPFWGVSTSIKLNQVILETDTNYTMSIVNIGKHIEKSDACIERHAYLWFLALSVWLRMARLENNYI